MVKDGTKPQHQHNVIYHAKCANKKCTSEYIRETRHRLGVRATEHNKTDNKSHLLIHAKETQCRRVWLNDFQIIGNGYKSNFKR